MLLVVALLTGLTLTAYLNSFSVPLLFDDALAITNNPSITHLHDLGAVLAPPHGATTAGRPLLNLSFALNYAFGGEKVAGYHLVNALLHLVAVFALFGVVRRALVSPVVGDRLNAAARPIALAVAAIWAVHPVHTATITYISQRAEVLMAVWWLLTLYWFARSAAAPREPLWAWLSGIACALGMLSKETMVTAPLAVLLYDRTFFVGSFRAALQKRWRYYGGLAATWVLLAVLMIDSRIAARGVGYQADVSAWTYALTQCRVVLEYARLALWPYPLVFDYGPEMMAKGLADVWPWVLAMLVLLGGTVLALYRKSPLGFLPAIFLLALAPTSSVVPVLHQPMAENRMYLPAAAVITLAVVAVYLALPRRGWLAVALLVLGLAALTVRRNADYGSALRIWTDTVAKRPDSPRAHNYLADALRVAGDLDGAIRHSEIALRLSPDNDIAHNNLGIVYLANVATLPKAAEHLEAAARLRPGYAPVLTNLGNALLRIPGRANEGLERLREAVRAMPDYAEAHAAIGTALLAHPAGAQLAAEEFAEAVRLAPKDAKNRINLAVALGAAGNFGEAARQAGIALQLQPDYPEAHLNLGNSLLRLPGRHLEALVHYRRAVQLRPAYPEAWYNIAVALEPLRGQEREAIAALDEVLRLQPGFVGARELRDKVEARLAAIGPGK